jgi:hypothetical protein
MPAHPASDPALTPFSAQAEAIVSRQIAARAAHPASGVSWSAMTREPPEVQSVEDVEAQLAATWARHEAWRASPEGRFYAAARLIYEATGDERLMNCISNGLDTNHERAALILERMSGPAADSARQALAEYVTARIVEANAPMAAVMAAAFGLTLQAAE